MSGLDPPNPLDEYRKRVEGKRPTDRPASKEVLLKQADGLRDLARLVMRLHDVVTEGSNRHRLERFAEELEESASRLERSAVAARSR